MRVFCEVRILVVPSVMGSPPKRTFLGSGRAAKGHQELHHSAHLVRAVREVAVVHARDEEHSHDVQAEAHRPIDQPDARPKCGERNQVHEQERDGLGKGRSLLGAAQSAMHVLNVAIRPSGFRHVWVTFPSENPPRSDPD
jgi:hypothetical protein